MSLLKKILWVALGFAIVPLTAALFARKEFAVDREIRIERPKAEVFAFVRLLKNQNRFSKWANIDPNMKTTMRGRDGTVGAVSAWESQNPEVGVGEQEIKSIAEGQRIDYELRFKTPMESTATAYMTTESAGPNATVVRWGFRSRTPYPMNLFMICANLEGMLARDFDTGLYNLNRLMTRP